MKTEKIKGIFKSLLLFSVFLLVLLTVTPEVRADNIRYQVTADYLNIRDGIGTSGTKVLGRINRDCQFEITQVKKNPEDGSTWGKTKYKNVTGWVNIGYAKKVSSSSSKASASTASSSGSSWKVCADFLNVRSDAGASNQVKGKVYEGNLVAVSDTKRAADGGKWAKISYKGLTGWVNMAYLKKQSSSNTNNTSGKNASDKNASGKNTSGKNTSAKNTSGKNGWIREDGLWNYYRNDVSQFSSNAMHTAFTKIEGEKSGSSFYLVVDREHFRVYAFYRQDGKWVPTRSMKCSVGKEGHETPTGTFTIFTRWDILKSGRTWEYYPVQFLKNNDGSWCFHSTLYYKGTELKDAASAKVYNDILEAAISQGCVRLSLDNAKWIYDNCTNGTKVLIY